jgi:hypothetical protein
LSPEKTVVSFYRKSQLKGNKKVPGGPAGGTLSWIKEKLP